MRPSLSPWMLAKCQAKALCKNYILRNHWWVFLEVTVFTRKKSNHMYWNSATLQKWKKNSTVKFNYKIVTVVTRELFQRMKGSNQKGKMPSRVFKETVLQPQSKCLSLSKNSLNDQKEGVWLNNRGKEVIISKITSFRNQKLYPRVQNTKCIKILLC